MEHVVCAMSHICTSSLKPSSSSSKSTPVESTLSPFQSSLIQLWVIVAFVIHTRTHTH